MYLWHARYTDGTEYPQLDPETGQPRDSASIDRKRLASVSLIDGLTGQVVLTQHFEPGQRLIYRRRTTLSPAGVQTVCHLLGWQRTVHGTNIQHIAFAFESGEVVNSGRYSGTDVRFAPIQAAPSDAEVVGNGTVE